MKIIFTAFSALLVVGCASAQSIRPNIGSLVPPDTTMLATWPATLRKPPATQLSLGSVHVRFGITTLQDVLLAVGVGKIEHHGDAGNSLTWLCYVTTSRGRASRVWLVSGEIDGGKYVTGASAKRVPRDSTATPDCPALPDSFNHIMLSSGVWLGSSNKELMTKVGSASHTFKAWRMFDYTKMFKAKTCEEAQQNSSLWVQLEDGHVVKLKAYQTKTC